MVKFCPPTVIVPVRAAPVFGSIEKLIVPLPLPVFVTVIHELLLTAVQEQPASVVILKLPAPLPAGKFALVGESEYGQGIVCR